MCRAYDCNSATGPATWGMVAFSWLGLTSLTDGGWYLIQYESTADYWRTLWALLRGDLDDG